MLPRKIMKIETIKYAFLNVLPTFTARKNRPKIYTKVLAFRGK